MQRPKGEPGSSSLRCAPGTLRCSASAGSAETRPAGSDICTSFSALACATRLRTRQGEPGTNAKAQNSKDAPCASLWGSDVRHPNAVWQRKVPRRCPDFGSPSLCLLSLGEARESESPAGARPGLLREQTRHQRRKTKPLYNQAHPPKETRTWQSTN